MADSNRIKGATNKLIGAMDPTTNEMLTNRFLTSQSLKPQNMERQRSRFNIGQSSCIIPT
jgi:hypothetical protein